MIALQAHAVSSGIGAEPGERTTWGLSRAELHDRYWASRGVQVVRRGVTSVTAKGPSLYLLVDSDELVIFELARPLKLLNTLKPHCVRLRVVDKHDEGYEERVHTDESGRLIAIRRHYRAATRCTSRVYLTPDAGLAQKWAQSQSMTDARRLVHPTKNRQRAYPYSCEGMVMERGVEGDMDRLTSALLRHWRAPGQTLESVYQYEPGVWVHETAVIDDTARIVAPAWIGAGVRLGADRIVLGPKVLSDAPEVHVAAGAVSWDEIRLPHWRLTPRLGRSPLRVLSKRLFDIGCALAVLLVTLPIYPVVCLLIYLEDGRPFFFAHKRQTLGGREFPCYKFRSMRRDAEQIKARLQAVNQCDGPQFYAKDDPRVLKIGKILRRTHIDELPQFYNILMGHMSVVGPRPSPDKENQYCPAWREGRLSVRPGLTGLWQVKRTRAPESDFQEWIRYDLEYVQHECWRMDIWIMLQTFSAVLRKRD
ncbi:MAG: sugar transferase [Phycisphaerales bacterium]